MVSRRTKRFGPQPTGNVTLHCNLSMMLISTIVSGVRMLLSLPFIGRPGCLGWRCRSLCSATIASSCCQNEGRSAMCGLSDLGVFAPLFSVQRWQRNLLTFVGKLLQEIRNASRSALVAQTAEPVDICRAGSRAGFGACNNPVDSGN